MSRKSEHEIYTEAYNSGYKSGQLGTIMELSRQNLLSIKAASNFLNISESEFTSLLKSNSTHEEYRNMILIPVGGRPTSYTPEIASDLAVIYKTMTIPELSDLYNVSIRTMNRWLKQAGLSKNNRKED
jgi:hypothetical protein